MASLASRLQATAAGTGAVLGIVAAAVVLWQLGYVFFAVENTVYEIEEAEQDARVCGYTTNCDVEKANAAVADMEQENQERRAVHWFRAGVGALALIGCGLLLLPEAIRQARQPAARSTRRAPTADSKSRGD